MKERLYGYQKFENVRGKWYCPVVFHSGEKKILFGKKYPTATTALRMGEYFQEKVNSLQIKDVE